MRDIDIRLALREELQTLHRFEPGTFIIDEFGLCLGSARIDLAVINGLLNGYEIKSERDTLERLQHQQEIYSKVLDNVTIVTSGKHINKVEERVPGWWGIEKAYQDGLEVKFRTIREPLENPCVEPGALVQLLWRDEILAALRELGLEKGYLSKPRRDLWKRLVDNLSVDEIRSVVRDKLKARANWRSVRSHTIGDG